MAGYGDDAGFTAYATAASYTVPAGTIAAARHAAAPYIDGLYGMRFPGVPTGGLAQPRAWPRTGATVYAATLASDLTPQRVIDASYEAAYRELVNPGSLRALCHRFGWHRPCAVDLYGRPPAADRWLSAGGPRDLSALHHHPAGDRARPGALRGALHLHLHVLQKLAFPIEVPRRPSISTLFRRRQR